MPMEWLADMAKTGVARSAAQYGVGGGGVDGQGDMGMDVDAVQDVKGKGKQRELATDATMHDLTNGRPCSPPHSSSTRNINANLPSISLQLLTTNQMTHDQH